jgi:predicted MFS family arabinose efflux permease
MFSPWEHNASVEKGEQEPMTARPAYRGYVLAVLLAGYTLSSFDRSVLNLLLEPIRVEFGASDAQLGLLSGLAFAVFYSTLSIPIAALADRWSRRNVLALSILIWTLMTALCGIAGSFAALLLTRIGVGIGQSGASPTSHSLIADYFPPHRRATALGIFTLGAAAGSMIAGLFGGWGAATLGWRTTLLYAALPGALLVPLVLLTVREPARVVQSGVGVAAPTIRAAVTYLWSKVSLRHLCLACALHSLSMYAASSFNPSMLARTHGWSGPAIGQLVAMTGFSGLAGTFLGGYFADRMSGLRGDARWLMWVPGVATLLVVPVQLVAYLGNGTLMVTAFVLSSLLSLVYFGPSYATMQTMADPRMRAVAAAVLLTSKAVIGMGLGPLLVGLASDALAPATGTGSLRFGLLLVPCFNLWASVHFFIGARHLPKDLPGRA